MVLSLKSGIFSQERTTQKFLA